MHLLIAISPHGFGHAAQVSAVLNALYEARPQGLRVTVQTTLPRDFLASRIDGPFDYLCRAADFGLLMGSALDIDFDASAARYFQLHREWERHVELEAQALEILAPDVVLADVPYLTLAAAARLGVPSLALCSLNWAGIYRHFFANRAEAAGILAQMESAYNTARLFLCPQPSMPMPELSNVRAIGPLARIGVDRREALRERLNLDAGQRLVLVAPGGIPTRLPMERWPASTDVRWLVPAAWRVKRADASAVEELGLDFADLLRSVDALVGKCGYGTVAECACNGTPMVYVQRPEWPEEPCLVDWLARHGRCAPVSRADVESGRVMAALETCWMQPQSALPVPTGAEEAARLILAEAGYAAR